MLTPAFPKSIFDSKKGLPRNGNPLIIMARPEGVEPPTAWFVVFRLKSHIALYLNIFIRITLSNKIGLSDLICLYLGLFDAIYWTTETIDFHGHLQTITW